MARTDGWDEHGIQLVWDAIALHTTHTIALYKEDVVKICALGIAVDFRGLEIRRCRNHFTCTGCFRQRVVPSPRPGCWAPPGHLGFCRTKPETTYGKLQPHEPWLCF